MSVLYSLFLLLLLASCSGEKYDLKNAISILPDDSEVLVTDPSLSSQNISYESDASPDRYLNLKQIASINSLSNITINNSENLAYYIDRHLDLVVFDLLTQKTQFKVRPFANIKHKKRNIFSAKLTYSEVRNIIVITFNSGDVFAIDMEEKSILWHKKIEYTSLISQPMVIKNNIFLKSNIGDIFAADIDSGEIVCEFHGNEHTKNGYIGIESESDIIPLNNGENLGIIERGSLSILNSQTGMVLDSITIVDGSDAQNFSHGDQILNIHISNKSDSIIVNTDSKIISFSRVYKMPKWKHNTQFLSNILNIGDYVTYITKDGKIVCRNSDSGQIRWVVDVKNIGKYHLLAIQNGRILALHGKSATIYDMNSGLLLSEEEPSFKINDIQKIEETSENSTYLIINNRYIMKRI